MAGVQQTRPSLAALDMSQTYYQPPFIPIYSVTQFLASSTINTGSRASEDYLYQRTPAARTARPICNCPAHYPITNTSAIDHTISIRARAAEQATHLVNAIRALRQRHYFAFYRDSLYGKEPHLFRAYHPRLNIPTILNHLQRSGIARTWDQLEARLRDEDGENAHYITNHQDYFILKPELTATNRLKSACEELKIDYTNIRNLIEQYRTDLFNRTFPGYHPVSTSTRPPTSKELRDPFTTLLVKQRFEELGAQLSIDRMEVKCVFPGQDRWDVYVHLQQLLNEYFERLVPKGSLPTAAAMKMSDKLFRVDEEEALAAMDKRRACDDDEPDEEVEEEEEALVERMSELCFADDEQEEFERLVDECFDEGVEV
ncbi:MAG: hypothetical protein Q9222_002436 [Ikaeria aurantiellina]